MNEDDQLIENAAEAWNKGETSKLPSPVELESASNRIAKRQGWSGVQLEEDTEGNKILTGGDLQDMLTQSRKTRATEKINQSETQAIWDAIKGIYDAKEH
ncbi:hypothetical protein [Xanthomonas sp. LF06-19]|uniref:hypothetical protein n=1 Tax=Xanthomonas sp. LF06-19 TaxID=3097551 RepID=UPI002A8286A9|nr:hypothetical protein [Xanthomonas sp. LF06-19]MDY4284366.1 hypothetical protein [Xanthomonas sp. LF06-19]